MPRIRIVAVVVVLVGLVVAVVVGREEPRHRVLHAHLTQQGCAETPVITSSSSSSFGGFDRRHDEAFVVEGCGARYDAVVREHREPTGRKNKHHRDVFEVVSWQRVP